MGGANLWWLGVSLEVVSTMSGTIGKQLIRFSELRKFTNPRVSRLSFYVGLFVNTICGPAIDMAAYSFAPQSLIAPFGGLDVVWNAMSAPYLLQEKLTLRRALGCILICVGTATAGAVGSHDDPVYTVEYLEDLLLAPRIPIYLIAFFLWFLLNVCCLQRRPRGSPIRGISLGMTAGTIAGNMFCVKAAVEIIQFSINENTAKPWASPLTYIMLFGAAFFAISNVKYMTQGLQEYEALFMVTVYEGSMIVSGCVSGSIVMLDLKDLEAWRIAVYWLAVMLIVTGMVVVFSNEMQNISSLAAGTASIEPKEMKELQNQTQVVLNVAGVGSAGMSTDLEGGCNTPTGSRSPASAPRSPRAALSPLRLPGLSPSKGIDFSLQVSTPERQQSGDAACFPRSPSGNGNAANGVEATPVGRSTSRPQEEDPSTPLSKMRL